MPKKGLAYNAPPKNSPAPADLRGFPELMGLVRKDHRKRMEFQRSGAYLIARANARRIYKGKRKKGKQG